MNSWELSKKTARRAEPTQAMDGLSAIAPRRRRGDTPMPSAEYYNRQADLFLTLSLASTSADVVARFRKMAEEYRALARSLASDQPDPRTSEPIETAAPPPQDQTEPE
jgi:hypothetical protein